MNYSGHRAIPAALVAIMTSTLFISSMSCQNGDNGPTGGGTTGLLAVAQLGKMAGVPTGPAVAVLYRLLDTEEGANVRMISAGDTLVLDDEGDGVYTGTLAVAFGATCQLRIATVEDETITGSTVVPDSFAITYPTFLCTHSTQDPLEVTWEQIGGADLVLVALDAVVEPSPEGLPWVCSPPLGGDATSLTVPDSVIPAQGGGMIVSVMGVAGGYVDPTTYDYYQSDENLVGALGFFGSVAQTGVLFTLVAP
jgi:hypothetical protein